MATGGQNEVRWNLVRVREIELENLNKRPGYYCSIHEYNSIVICQGKIIVLDIDEKNKIRIHRHHDGKFLDKLESEASPRDICLIDATTICVLHDDGLITMASIKSENVSPVFTRMTSFRLHGVFDFYTSVVRVKNNIVVVGVKQGMTYWCIVSLDHGHVDTIHRICKGSRSSDVTTKDNIIYISCCDAADDDEGVHFNVSGVYAFDILNPNQCKYKYKHHRLDMPKSIVIKEDGNIFVGNGGFHSCIYQLTASCQLVAIFALGIPRNLLKAMFWDNGRLYVTCEFSRDITVFRHMYQGSHKASDVLASHETKQPGIEELAIQITLASVDFGKSSAETEMPPSGPSPEDSEDEKQAKNHTDSDVQISNEGKELAIEGTSTQIGQEIVDNGQSIVDTERPSSGPSQENSEDDTQGNHTDLEVPIRDEGEQPVSEVTYKQIGKEIRIEQSVEEELNQAEIKMSTEDRDLFIKFQNEIGTDIYFSKGTHRLLDGQETLNSTETFLEQNRPDMKDKWLEYKSQGKLTPELIDVIYAEERNQELHERKDYFLNMMEQLNIIVKARAFNENGVKEDNYFFIPCMLHKESPREVIAPETDARMDSTSVLCWVIKGTSMLLEIFQKLIAACLSRWPVAKRKNTSESLIFQNCTVFDLDPVHRLVLHCENHAVFARITRMGIDHVNAKMCTRVRKFITLNLSHQDPNLKYQLCVETIESQDITGNIGSCFSPPFEMWLFDEVHDPAAPITREHMNHARLCVAIVAICGNAMRTILLANPPAPHTNIFQAILANKTKLISRTQDGSGKWQKALLNKDQCKIMFPDPKRQYVASIDKFDISLLYILIRNISSVKPPSTGWGVAPQDRPRDKSLGANVERIRLYRNEICGHNVDGQNSQPEFDNYWKKIDSVLRDIDVIVGQAFSQELKMQSRQVISVYEAC